jgi:sugar transferase (PEP-CTERM/EpsH1 system associated)
LRLFVVLSRFPYPLERGDKLRAFHQLRILSKHHSIYLFALHEHGLEEEWLNAVRPFCVQMETFRLNRAVQLQQMLAAMFTTRPFQVAYFYDPKAKARMAQVIADWKPDAIYCQLLRTADYVKDMDNIPKVIDFQDAFSKGMERRLLTDPWYMRPFIRSEMKRLSTYEAMLSEWFDGSTIISEQDREQLPFAGRDAVHIVRNGVQMDVYAPSDTPKSVDVLFAGNMGYPPNVEAGLFLGNEVMPLLWKHRPETDLMLAGARPTAQVRQLAQRHIAVTGWVDDMRDCYAKARVFAAPMFIGTGLQNKLLEAMAMKLPCVTTPLANNALKAVAGKEVLIASTPREFAEAIHLLISDPAKAAEIAENGHAFIRDRFSWEAQTATLLQLLEKVVDNKTY